MISIVSYIEIQERNPKNKKKHIIYINNDNINIHTYSNSSIKYIKY